MKNYLKFFIIIIPFFLSLIAVVNDVQSAEKETTVPNYCNKKFGEEQDSNSSESDEVYTIIVDAGSSGNRVYLFKWWTSKSQDRVSGIVKFECEKNEIPLSSFSSDPGKAHIEKLDEVLKDIQQEVDIYILATAGMRRLSLEKQTAIYTALCGKYLSSIELETCLKNNIRTITGNEEAGFAWLSMNREAIINKKRENLIQGMLELGGASMQIAVLADSAPRPENSFTFTYDSEYTLYTVSYLELGQNRVISHITSTTSVEDCYPTGYKLPDQKEGKWNAEECKTALIKYLDSEEVCEKNKTICNNKRLEFKKVGGERFKLFSNFYYTANFLKLKSSWSLAKFKEVAEDFCSKSWDDMVKENENIKPSYLKGYCLSAVYITLLLERFGFEDENEFKAFESDWTGGAMLYYATKSPNNREDSPPTTGQSIHSDADNTLCQQDYIVQPNDTLSLLANKFYGDITAYPIIHQATNEAALLDNSYATISNVDIIEVSWKLCIPEH